MLPVSPGDLSLQRRELLDHRALTRIDLAEQTERFVMPLSSSVGVPLDERQRAAGLEATSLTCASDSMPCRRAAASSSATVISSRSRWWRRSRPLSNERVRLSLDRVELAIVVERAHDDGVRGGGARRADEPANERIVIADDRVLHRVRQQQQHDEIERIELRQLAFAGEAKADQQKGVDDRRANELLAERNVRE